MNSDHISRRDFLRLSGLGLSSMVLPNLFPWKDVVQTNDFPSSERLGRVVVDLGEEINLRARPSTDARKTGILLGDDVVPWLREVVGYTPYRNQRWVETLGGFIWAPLLQPVANHPNGVLQTLPDASQGSGLWAEVTVPYVAASLANLRPIGPRVTYLVENNLPIRFYYGQVVWVDDIRVTEMGEAIYHIRELHGSYGDHFWAPVVGFRPISPKDINPITPEVEDKHIQIDLNRQTLSCYEEGREIFFCRISSGRFGTETPTGDHLRIFWKLFSVHMSGGTAGAGYDLTGIGWPTYFASGGIAIHGTFWHNNYGERTSAGCVNATPEAAKFVSLWSQPTVPYYPGEIDVGGTTLGTSVRVIED